MTKKSEFQKLADMLLQAKIPHEIHCFIVFDGDSRRGTAALFYSNSDQPVCTVVENEGKGMLCIQALLTDEEREEDEYSKDLSAEEVFRRIKAHWEVYYGINAKKNI